MRLRTTYKNKHSSKITYIPAVPERSTLLNLSVSFLFYFFFDTFFFDTYFFRNGQADNEHHRHHGRGLGIVAGGRRRSKAFFVHAHDRAHRRRNPVIQRIGCSSLYLCVRRCNGRRDWFSFSSRLTLFSLAKPFLSLKCTCDLKLFLEGS